MSPIYNFSAGPAMMPQAVLRRAHDEFLSWQQSGINVMEMSHRGRDFMAILEHAEAQLRTLMAIPENYHVLFLQGGATLQFSAIPLNLLADNQQADYFHTGQWSEKAIAEARRYCQVNIVAQVDHTNQPYAIPAEKQWQFNPDAAYVHYTANETIDGIEFDTIPDSGDVPLVVDLSSTILSRPIDVSRFGLIYAGAQKNIGPAGLTVVIVRDDLLGRSLPAIPAILDYQRQVKYGSMYNTPPTYAIYLAGLVFDWLMAQGGLNAMAAMNARKANSLYDYIDQSDFYHNSVAVAHRSWMNIPFTLSESSLDAAFLAEAEQQQLIALKGHRSIGGMRASIYNAMPEAGVAALIAFMTEFAQRHQ